ncbi:MAG: hypothetical protein ACRDJ2_06455 [Actinomycetota bacterium]
MEGNVLDALDWHLTPFRRPAPLDEMVGALLYHQGDPLRPDTYWTYERGDVFDGTLANVVVRALWDIHQLPTKFSRDFLMLHAGVVARGGHSLLLPAVQNTGKSSLTTALVLEGFDYLSDEIGAIDPITARLYPFPKHIWLDDDSLEHFPGLPERLGDGDAPLGEFLPQRYVRPVDDLGARVSGPAPAGWIVFPSMDRGGPARLEALAKSDALHRLATNCFNLFRYGERGLFLFRKVVEASAVFELRGGTPRGRATLLAGRFPW